MNLKHLDECIDHDEATIQSFMRDPKFAIAYFRSVMADGDAEEIREVKGWIDEARARLLERETELEAAMA